MPRAESAGNLSSIGHQPQPLDRARAPPGAQPALGLLRAERTLVESHLQQEAVRLADLAARASGRGSP